MDPREFKGKKVREFLNKISALESSGGKNLNHKVITDPDSMHYGTHAVGQYGVMPVTAKDLDRKYGTDELQDLDKMEAQEYLMQDPELAERLAESHASTLLQKSPEEVAAYKWKQGQYSKPTEAELNDSDRVRKFRVLQKNVK